MISSNTAEFVASNGSRFTVGSTVYGYEVSDNDGRPVTTDELDFAMANSIASDLNAASVEGPEALAIALGCVDEDAGWDA